MYGVQNVVSDAEIEFNDPEVQAVLICTSTDTHADYIIRAAECGKDIYCEKPIDLSVEKIERALASTAASTGTSAAPMRQFRPARSASR